MNRAQQGRGCPRPLGPLRTPDGGLLRQALWGRPSQNAQQNWLFLVTYYPQISESIERISEGLRLFQLGCDGEEFIAHSTADAEGSK